MHYYSNVTYKYNINFIQICIYNFYITYNNNDSRCIAYIILQNNASITIVVSLFSVIYALLTANQTLVIPHNVVNLLHKPMHCSRIAMIHKKTIDIAY